MGVAACEGANHAWSRGPCAGRGQLAPLPARLCTHPACVRIAKDHAAESGQFTSQCTYTQGLQAANGGKTDSYCLHSMAPWAARGELNARLGLGSANPNPNPDPNPNPNLTLTLT